MTKLMAFVLALGVAASSAAAEEEVDPELAKSGGLVQVPGTGKGRIRIISSQKVVPLAELEKAFEKVTDLMKLNVEFSDGPAIVPGADAPAAAKCDFVINVIDDKAKTAPLLLAPEERWAVVNIAPLLKDDPMPKRINSRVKKETMRAFGWLCGCVNASYEGSVMGPMRNLVAMDGVRIHELPIDSYNRVLDYLGAYRVTRKSFCTYRSACKEGWAPAPTNKWQQAIWDEYKDPKKRFDKDFPKLAK